MVIIIQGRSKPVVLPADLAADAKEGDVLDFKLEVLERESEKERAEIADLIRNLQE